LDLSMPVMNGLEAAPLLIKILPKVWIILFTVHDEPEMQRLSRQVSGNTEQEIMPKIEQHGREKHNMTIDDQTRNKVRNAIHKQAA
jgi:predicted small metal-binding protein